MILIIMLSSNEWFVYMPDRGVMVEGQRAHQNVRQVTNTG